jgi:hypothetical protein
MKWLVCAVLEQVKNSDNGRLESEMESADEWVEQDATTTKQYLDFNGR